MKKQFRIKYNKEVNLFSVYIMGISYTMSYLQLSNLKNEIADRLFKYQETHRRLKDKNDRYSELIKNLRKNPIVAKYLINKVKHRK